MDGFPNSGGSATTTTGNPSTVAAAAAATATHHDHHHLLSRHPGDDDDYWRDDFRPLRDAGGGILSVLRRDEDSPQGDLYRRIISKAGGDGVGVGVVGVANVDPESNPDHRYFYPAAAAVGGNENGITAAAATATVATFDDGGGVDLGGRGRGGRGGEESPVQHVGTVPLPAALQEKRKDVKVSTMMGLFPRGGLAWMTIDDTVYLWSYNSSMDGTLEGAAKAGESGQMVEYQVPRRQPIVSVGLAPPKPGVFKDMVEWCLVLTTKEEAMLCVVAKSTPALGAPWVVVPTRFIVPSDWVSFLCVGSSSDGRIFLGGQDGSLYELDYDILSAPPSDYSNRRGGHGPSDAVRERLDRFYDGSDDVSDGPLSSTACPDVLVDKSLVAFRSSAEYFAHVGKRAFDAAFATRRGRFGGDGGSDGCSPPRKCRKLNHSDGGIWKHVLPDFVTKVGAFVFGDTSSAAGGAITQIVVDDERQLLYTLTSPKGWICVFDMQTPSTTASTSFDSMQQPSHRKQSSKLTLAAVLDAPSTARSYLESVGRGRLTPTSTTLSSSREGRLTFLGNAEVAQAGVGGMEGARRILRQVEASKATSRQRGNAAGGRNRRGAVVNVLTPVSLQVIPYRESTRITLLAVTAGGLRYYLSTLDSRSIGTGPPLSRSGNNPWRPPGNRMTLYHIRAPPQLDAASDTASGIFPATQSNLRVDATCYRHGTWFVAFEPVSGTGSSNSDTLIAVSHDCSKRYAIKGEKDVTNYVSPGGICELVSPYLSTADGMSGGRVWGIEPGTLFRSKAMALSIHSKTPTDSELNYVVPPYTPSNKKIESKLGSAPTSGGSIVPATKSGILASPAFGVMMNILRGRPAAYGIVVQRPIVENLVKVPSYRVSSHTGSDGFSKSSAESFTPLKSGPIARSPRLSTWLLRPESVSIAPFALQHLEPFESTFVALNVGGIHSYKYVSALGKLRSAILASGPHAEKDPNVGRFFQDYGLIEGCAMCFMLAISPFSDRNLIEWSLHTAIRHSRNPCLLEYNESQTSSFDPMVKNDPWVPPGYMFKSSAICDGLYTAAARLLRPIWYKPAVVVTEGKLVRRGLKSITTPAKVELLLDDDTLNDIARPLVEFQSLVERFHNAVANVPTRGGNNPASRRNWTEGVARCIEERNIHSLYRLVTRTTQLLNLLYHLCRADVMPDVPEVEWGLLHGIQIAQFVETSFGQERIENVLNKLVTSTEKTMRGPSADANNLAEVLSNNCYHYFSSGNRNAFLGFQAAHEATTLPLGHSRRATKTAEAADYLLKAAKFWYSPTLVTGQLLQTQDSEGFVEVAERAIRRNSPLAKACSCLIELGDVASVVDVCLATAENFNSKGGSVSRQHPDLEDLPVAHSWEIGLYHKRQNMLSSDLGTNGSLGKTTPIGTNVTPKEAINTCYALIFYYLSKFLDSPVESESHVLGEVMVSVCAFEADKSFLPAFFEFMLKDNHKDVLLLLTSSHLEEWLIGKQQENPDLLRQYYQVQQQHRNAGELARHRACNRSSKMKLDDRIELLGIAVTSLDAALGAGENVGQYKRETETALNVANLQRRTLQMIDYTAFEVSDDVREQLEVSLVEATDLHNHFCRPFEMFDICLLLVAVCNKRDETYIKELWKSALCATIIPCFTRNNDTYKKLMHFAEGTHIHSKGDRILLLDASDSPGVALFDDGSWVVKLEDCVVSLGQEIIAKGADFAFPVEFVASCLEELRGFLSEVSIPLGKGVLAPDWTFSLLLRAGVPFKFSFDAVYQVMVRAVTASTDGLGFKRKLQNMDTAVSILESFASGVRAHRPGYESAKYLEVKFVIDEVRVELQSIPENVAALENRLYEVEKAMSDIA